MSNKNKISDDTPYQMNITLTRSEMQDLEIKGLKSDIEELKDTVHWIKQRVTNIETIGQMRG